MHEVFPSLNHLPKGVIILPSFRTHSQRARNMDVIKMIHVKGQAAKRLQANPVEKK